jgi:hypothetical protein
MCLAVVLQVLQKKHVWQSQLSILGLDLKESFSQLFVLSSFK